jgi:hypothetical protein
MNLLFTGVAPDSRCIHQFVGLPPLNITKGPWVAGGSARKLFTNNYLGRSDIDLFFPSMESFEAYRLAFIHANPNFKEFADEWCSTFILDTRVIQMIKGRFFSSVQELLGSFDMSVTMFATDLVAIVHTQQGVDDAEHQMMRIVNDRAFKRPRLRRLAKYCGTGFTPTPGLITQMLCLNDPKFPEYVGSDLLTKDPAAYIEKDKDCL